MKLVFKHIIVSTFLLFNILTLKSQALITPPVMIPIGNVDTLQWLQTHIANQSAHFSGKPISILWDSLYALRWKIAEYNPPFNLKQVSMGVNGGNEYNKDTLFVQSLTFYFAPISNGGIIDQLHENHDWNNLKNHTNYPINTHVKFFKVTFQNPIKYLRSIASSINGSRKWQWGGFQEYYWGGNIVQSVTVGEY